MARKKFNPPYVAKNFACGFTMPWIQSEVVDLLSYTAYQNLSSYFISHHMAHARYGGGTPSRVHFWNDVRDNSDGSWTSDQATDILNAFYANRDYAQINSRTTSDAYLQFLNMCVNSAIEPLIVLNTMFYIYNRALYPIEQPVQDTYAARGIDGMTCDEDRWTNSAKIRSHIQGQAITAHQYYKKQNGTDAVIKWEIGNENHTVLSATNYVHIAVQFISWIKTIYPNDKFFVSLSKGMVIDEAHDQWNTDVITGLNNAGYLQYVDFFVVHFYASKLYSGLEYFSGTTPVQATIDTRVEDTFFNSQLMAGIKSYFDDIDDYTPRFAITEFNVIDDSLLTIEYTQMHAIFMLDSLMKFRSEANVKIVTKHAGNILKNGMFFLKNVISTFPWINPKTQNDSAAFPYVTAHAKATAIFFDNLGDDFVSYSLNAMNNGVEVLVTQTSGVFYAHILNYKNTVATGFDISSYEGGVMKIFRFNDLASNTWEEASNTIETVAGATLDVPIYSLVTIKK